MTREKAIRETRKTVSPLYRAGGDNNWSFSTWDEDRSAWSQSSPKPYDAARADRAQAMIDYARGQMDYWPDRIYNGGRWTDYLPR